MEENKDIPAGENLLPESKGSPPGEEKHNADPELQQETPLTFTQTPEENMEVHHHPHIHHKKRWMDYMFEFLMLFIAVSLGFFVENLREHYVEHVRAREYAAMLRKDLAADTTIMNIIINFRTEQKKDFDSLKSIIVSTPFEKINQQDFLRMANSAGKYLHLIANNGTLQQLKSSGSLRYFTDTTLVYALTSYEEDLKHGDYVQAEEKQHCSENVMPFMIKHFNNLYAGTLTARAGMPNFPETGFVDFDKKAMLEFYNLLDKCASYNQMLGYSNFMPHKQKAALLIKMLEKEYHLK